MSDLGIYNRIIHHCNKSSYIPNYKQTINKGMVTEAPVKRCTQNLGDAKMAPSASNNPTEVTKPNKIKLICAPESIIS